MVIIMKQKKTMDLILIIIGILILLFTAIMIWLFLMTGAIPDTLCTCFFVACTGECGFMGWIKTAKTRYQEHQWEEDKEKRQDALIEAQKKAMKNQETNIK